jgi:hypothetical protein
MVTTQRPSAASFERRLGSHPFPIDDQPPERHVARGRFVPREQACGSLGQVQIASMGSGQERMALFIM